MTSPLRHADVGTTATSGLLRPMTSFDCPSSSDCGSGSSSVSGGTATSGVYFDQSVAGDIYEFHRLPGIDDVIGDAFGNEAVAEWAFSDEESVVTDENHNSRLTAESAEFLRIVERIGSSGATDRDGLEHLTWSPSRRLDAAGSGGWYHEEDSDDDDSVYHTTVSLQAADNGDRCPSVVKTTMTSGAPDENVAQPTSENVWRSKSRRKSGGGGGQSARRQSTTSKKRRRGEVSGNEDLHQPGSKQPMTKRVAIDGLQQAGIVPKDESIYQTTAEQTFPPQSTPVVACPSTTLSLAPTDEYERSRSLTAPSQQTTGTCSLAATSTYGLQSVAQSHPLMTSSSPAATLVPVQPPTTIYQRPDVLGGLNAVLPSLPFALPSLPTGYSMVITHRQSLSDDPAGGPQHVTQIFISNPPPPPSSTAPGNPAPGQVQQFPTSDVPCFANTAPAAAQATANKQPHPAVVVSSARNLQFCNGAAPSTPLAAHHVVPQSAAAAGGQRVDAPRQFQWSGGIPAGPVDASPRHLLSQSVIRETFQPFDLSSAAVAAAAAQNSPLMTLPKRTLHHRPESTLMDTDNNIHPIQSYMVSAGTHCSGLYHTAAFPQSFQKVLMPSTPKSAGCSPSVEHRPLLVGLPPHVLQPASILNSLDESSTFRRISSSSSFPIQIPSSSSLATTATSAFHPCDPRFQMDDRMFAVGRQQQAQRALRPSVLDIPSVLYDSLSPGLNASPSTVSSLLDYVSPSYASSVDASPLNQADQQQHHECRPQPNQARQQQNNNNNYVHHHDIISPSPSSSLCTDDLLPSSLYGMSPVVFSPFSTSDSGTGHSPAPRWTNRPHSAEDVVVPSWQQSMSSSTSGVQTLTSSALTACPITHGHRGQASSAPTSLASLAGTAGGETDESCSGSPAAAKNVTAFGQQIHQQHHQQQQQQQQQQHFLLQMSERRPIDTAFGLQDSASTPSPPLSPTSGLDLAAHPTSKTPCGRFGRRTNMIEALNEKLRRNQMRKSSHGGGVEDAASTRNLQFSSTGLRIAAVSPRRQSSAADCDGSEESESSSGDGCCRTDPCGEACRAGKRFNNAANETTPMNCQVAKGAVFTGSLREMPALMPTGHVVLHQTSPTDLSSMDVIGFRFSLDAPMSTLQQSDEDRITYLNKGQYYRLSMEYRSGGNVLANNSFKSVVMVLFGDNITVGDELEAWRLWHSRQPSFKQRILDIDYKNSSGVSPNSMEELAYNATSVVWSPLDQPVKVNVAVNCLSTDFSNQKGVKGIPLHIQIDTYDNTDPTCTRIHRAVCKIKIFCEKGAERKVRDEERKRNLAPVTKKEPSTGIDDDDRLIVRPVVSNFRTVIDNNKPPVLFNPSADMPSVLIAKSPVDRKPFLFSSAVQKSQVGRRDDGVPTRGQLQDSPPTVDTKPVLLYVREQQEMVFTALLLQTPTVPALIQAIEEMGNLKTGKIKNVFKKSKKGILVRMDDKILQHYTNESAFVISTSSSVITSQLPGNGYPGYYDVILTETDSDA